jgi:hypothetical protein
VEPSVSRELNDTRLMWKLMNEAGTAGKHSHDLRREGVTGNPSQRAKDITSKGFPVYTVAERRGRRPGSRYWLEEYAPDHAHPVLPNGGSGAELAAGDTQLASPSNPAGRELGTEPPDRIICDAFDRSNVRFYEERDGVRTELAA